MHTMHKPWQELHAYTSDNILKMSCMCIMAVPARMWGLLEGFARDTRYDYGIGLVNNTVSKD